jgi:hypothetical protein
MGKQPGKRRKSLRALLKQRQARAERTGGEVCAGCGQAVAFDGATFYRAGGAEVVYCLDCAFFSDTAGYVALLWEAQAKRAPERGREGASLMSGGGRV